MDRPTGIIGSEIVQIDCRQQVEREQSTWQSKLAIALGMLAVWTIAMPQVWTWSATLGAAFTTGFLVSRFHSQFEGCSLLTINGSILTVERPFTGKLQSSDLSSIRTVRHSTDSGRHFCVIKTDDLTVVFEHPNEESAAMFSRILPGKD